MPMQKLSLCGEKVDSAETITSWTASDADALRDLVCGAAPEGTACLVLHRTVNVIPLRVDSEGDSDNPYRTCGRGVPMEPSTAPKQELLNQQRLWAESVRMRLKTWRAGDS
jgi:hypothetical protein